MRSQVQFQGTDWTILPCGYPAENHGECTEGEWRCQLQALGSRGRVSSADGKRPVAPGAIIRPGVPPRPEAANAYSTRQPVSDSDGVWGGHTGAAHQPLRRAEALRILGAHRADFDRFGVRSLAVFGSVARDEAGPDSDKVRLDDILEAIDRITGYATGMSYEAFADDCRTVDAVLHNFAVVGEAAHHLPPEVEGRYPQVPWARMRGRRNVVVHEYSKGRPGPWKAPVIRDATATWRWQANGSWRRPRPAACPPTPPATQSPRTNRQKTEGPDAAASQVRPVHWQ
jgi:uncharacterized protein with HEPN domain